MYIFIPNMFLNSKCSKKCIGYDVCFYAENFEFFILLKTQNTYVRL